MKKQLLFCFLLACLLFSQAQANTFKIKGNPIIGISCSHSNNSSSVRRTYTESVIQAGGIPLLIPVTTDSTALANILNKLDGIILTGGEDIAPSYYHEGPIPEIGEIDSLRDVYDMSLIRFAARRNIPMLGICRGEQLINVAFGGSLYQDIPAQHPGSAIQHQQKEPSSVTTHIVNILPGSTLAKITGCVQLNTNSHHHQAVKQVAPGFKVTAWSTDSIPEAIESSYGYPIWGVQFHPEALTVAGDTIELRIFRFLVSKAATFQQAKIIHSHMLSIDTHTDAPLRFNDSYNISSREKSQVCIPKMEEGHLDAQYLACWVRQNKCDDENTQKAIARIHELIQKVHQQIELNKDKCMLARTADDLPRIKAEGKKAFYIGIENGYGIGKDLKNIGRYKEEGVTYITLCHTRNNDICDSSSDSIARWGGLSPYGRKVIKEMNRLGMIIDLSHAAESTFYDVIKLSKVPVIASHSSSSSIYTHNRNLTDKQLRALATNGGVAQACLVDEYLRADYKSATINDFMNHLLHMIKVAGIDHVGIGSDFDGGGGVKGCNSDSDFINITTRLLEHGYTEKDIAKIWGGNFLRVMEQVQQRNKTPNI